MIGLGYLLQKNYILKAEKNTKWGKGYDTGFCKNDTNFCKRLCVSVHWCFCWSDIHRLCIVWLFKSLNRLMNSKQDQFCLNSGSAGQAAQPSVNQCTAVQQHWHGLRWSKGSPWSSPRDRGMFVLLPWGEPQQGYHVNSELLQ